MPKNKLRVEPNERIDIQDFQYLINAGIHDNTEQLLESLMCSTTRTKKWILSGFTMSNPSAKQLQVTKGKAILAERRDGAVRYGMLVTEGDATKTIDLNTYSAGDYGIYIRFEAVAGENASRIFWNPAGDGSEYASSIQTRYQANWSLRVEAASPGAEWLRIGTVAQATMAITDEREFYFEGSLPDSYESGWSADGGGIANDRNADRATYGITDLQGFTAATRQCLTDIKGRGLREWYERDIGGMNIGFDADPVEGRLAIGDAYFNFELNTSNPRLNLDQYDYLEYTRSANTLKVVLDTVDIFSFSETALLPLGTQNIGGSSNRWNTGYFGTANSVNAAITSADVTGGTGAPSTATVSTGGSITSGANINDAANGLKGEGGSTSTGGGDGGKGVYGQGGAANSTGSGGDGGYFVGGASSSGTSGHGVWAKGGDAGNLAALPHYGGYFMGGTPYASSGDNGVYGLLGKGGPGEGSGIGGVGVRGEGGSGGAAGNGGMGGYFYGADSNGSANGGWGALIQGGAGAEGRNSGQGLEVGSQTITWATGSAGLGAKIVAGAISNASNPGDGARGLEVYGGGVSTGGGFGGEGIYSKGGNSGADYGGDGVFGTGGNGAGAGKWGGFGIKGVGGNGTGSAVGGPGVYGQGGTGTTYDGVGGQFDRKTNAANIHLTQNVSTAFASSASGDMWIEGTGGSMALKVNLNGNITTLALGA